MLGSLLSRGSLLDPPHSGPVGGDVEALGRDFEVRQRELVGPGGSTAVPGCGCPRGAEREHRGGVVAPAEWAPHGNAAQQGTKGEGLLRGAWSPASWLQPRLACPPCPPAGPRIPCHPEPRCRHWSPALSITLGTSALVSRSCWRVTLTPRRPNTCCQVSSACVLGGNRPCLEPCRWPGRGDGASASVGPLSA